MKAGLKKIQIANEPVHTKAVITSSVRSSVGQHWVWIVVEDEDDKRVYQKFMTERARVLPSLSENGSKGCKNVMQITKELRAKHVSENVIGIRDADYTRFVSPAPLIPSGVYCTDQRDMEMMLLSCGAVQRWLSVAHTIEPAFWTRIVTQVLRPRGEMRLLNDVLRLGCSFKKYADIAVLWDNSKKKLKTNYTSLLHKDFLSHCGNHSYKGCKFSSRDLSTERKRRNLAAIGTYELCQGHDSVRMIQYELSRCGQYEIDDIMEQMRNLYTLADFQQTQLYQSLKSWEQLINITFLK